MKEIILEAIKKLGGRALLDQIFRIVGIRKETLSDLLRTMVKRGEIERKHEVVGCYRGGQGFVRKYQYVYYIIE